MIQPIVYSHPLDFVSFVAEFASGEGACAALGEATLSTPTLAWAKPYRVAQAAKAKMNPDDLLFLSTFFFKR